MNLEYDGLEWWNAIEIVREKIDKQIHEKKTKKERNKKGQHPTPFDLARQIVSITKENYLKKTINNIRFLEPAIGLGTFYSALLDVSEGCIPEHALGVEKYVEISKFTEMIWGSFGLTVSHNDFTELKPPEDEKRRFDLILTNPPYVRHHHLIRKEKRDLQKKVQSQIGLCPNGLMGLYGYFLFLSHNWMKENAIGVWLIPREFLNVNYGTIIKKYLLEQVKLLRIHSFNIIDQQFSDADVSSCIVFLQNTKPSNENEVVFSFGKILTPDRQIIVKNEMLKKIDKWSALEEKDPLILSSQEGGVIIGDLFRVKRGYATGNNKFFIKKMNEWEKIGIPVKFLTPTLPSSRNIKTNIIEADDDGYPRTNPQLFVFNCSENKTTLKLSEPKVYEYIMGGEMIGINNGHLASKRNPWYKLEKRSPAPIIFAYMGRKNTKRGVFRFYRNKSKALVTNAYYNLYPKKEVFNKITNREEAIDLIFNLLNKLDSNELITKGRSYGGGLHKLEPNELSKLKLEQQSVQMILGT